jgi:rhodanese-related sulfurtransferase
MQQFLEYVANHPVLVGATVLLAVAAVAYELSRARSGGQAIGPLDAVRLMNQGGALVLDVRSKDQYDAGHVIDARNVPSAELAQGVEALKKYRDKPVVTCCETGMTAGAAARTLRAQGFSKVASLRGGLEAWRAENLPLVRTDARGR